MDDDNPKRRSNDRNSLTRWITGVAALTLVAGSGLYVQSIAREAKEAKDKVALVSEEQAGMKEAVKRVDEKVTDFITEQRTTNKEFKDNQQKALDILIEMKSERRDNRRGSP